MACCEAYGVHNINSRAKPYLISKGFNPFQDHICRNSQSAQSTKAKTHSVTGSSFATELTGVTSALSRCIKLDRTH